MVLENNDIKQEIEKLVNRVYDRGYTAGYTNCNAEWFNKNEYQKGYEQGKKAIEKCSEKITYKDIDDAYQRGLEDAWKYAKKIREMDCITEDNIFGEYKDAFEDYSASEAIIKIRAYESESHKCSQCIHFPTNGISCNSICLKCNDNDMYKEGFITLDEAIEHCEDTANSSEDYKEYYQLAEWLKELKELKGDIIRRPKDDTTVI